MDHPNKRSSHVNATPRGGGISFVLVGTILTIVYTPSPARWIPLICLPLALIGLIDDFRDLPTFTRYLIQLITAIVLVSVSTLSRPFWLSVVFVILITAIINFVNFMDGLDGLVAGCSVLMIGGASSWAVSGAIFGFLLWNWSPAKVFMGDVGSTFIGGVFGGLILQTHTYHDSFHIFLIGFPLLADPSLCVVRRFFNGENIFIAHRKHLFQRMQQAGYSHQVVSGIYISAVGLIVCSSSLDGYIGQQVAILFVISLGLYFDRYLAIPFKKS